MHATSKAFRARIEGLRRHEVLSLQRWALNNCALSAMFCSDRSTILVAVRDVKRSSASFARSVRGAMRKMGISTLGLRGHWLHLLSEKESLALCSDRMDLPLTATAGPEGGAASQVQSGEADVKVVQLRQFIPNWSRQRTAWHDATANPSRCRR